jgi:hypothetical protein
MATCEICGGEFKNLGVHARKHAKVIVHQPEIALNKVDTSNLELSTDSKESALLQRLAELEKRDAENQKKIQMLYEVADKGRVFSWESRQKQDRQPQRVKLSVVDGKYLIGWRTVRDELIQDPKTGRTVGEMQQYELKLSGPDGETTKSIDGYLNFSNLRYEKRVECQVISKSESYDGELTFEIGLPDGRELRLNSRYVN